MNGEEGRFWMLFLANPRRLRAAPTWPTRGVIFPDRSPPERFSFVAPSERSRPTRVGAVVSLHQASAFRASTRARTSALELVRRDTAMPFDLVVRHAIYVPSPVRRATKTARLPQKRGFVSGSDRPRRPAVREYPRFRARVDGLDPPRRRQEMRYPRAS